MGRVRFNLFQCICVKKQYIPALGEEISSLATGGSADHLINLYTTEQSGNHITLLASGISAYQLINITRKH